MNFFNAGLSFTPEVYVLYKKVEGAGGQEPWIFIYILFIIQSLWSDKCL